MEPRDTSTAWTLVLTAALGVGLSLAPVPEALRPLPSLTKGPLPEQLAALLKSSAGARQAAGVNPDALPDAYHPALSDAIPPEDEPTVTEAPPPLLPPEDSVPTASPLGLDDLGPDALAVAMQLEALREKMGARHVDVELNCRRSGPSGCEESGLAAFFAALESLRDAPRPRSVRVVTLGDSLIASDHITDVVRERLQERHGSGGKGFLFVDRPTRSGRGVRAGTASQGWEFARIIDRAPPKGRLGFSGVAFSAASGNSQDVRFALEGARVAELYFLVQPHGGSVQLSVDGKSLQRIQTRWSPPEVALARVKLPEGARTLQLRTRGKVEVHGVALENAAPGVVFDTVGLPGAYAGVFLRTHPPFFRSQLRQRKPALVVLMMGGNEAFRLTRDWTNLEEVRHETEQLVDRVQEALPRASCLMLSPLDAAVRTVGGELVPRRYTREVAEVLREVARAKGCAYWDALEAMGGEGAAIRWLSSGLLNEDLVHPRSRGSDLLGHLMDTAVERAFTGSRRAKVPVADEPGLFHASKALASTFERLRTRAGGESLRVDMLQLGGTSSAAEDFSEAVRTALTSREGQGAKKDGDVSALGAALELEPPEVLSLGAVPTNETRAPPSAEDAGTPEAPSDTKGSQLLVVWYGDEENGPPKLEAERLRREYGALIAWRREEAGGAECLLIGPKDRLRAREDGGWTEMPSLATVLSVLPKVAEEQGCAWWSARAAMGGERSMLRWQRAGLGAVDGVHLTHAGQARLANALVRALEAAYEASKTQAQTTVVKGG